MSILNIPLVYILCTYFFFSPVCCFFVTLFFGVFGDYTVYISSCHHSWTFVYIYGALNNLQLANIYIYIYIYIYICICVNRSVTIHVFVLYRLV